MGIKDSVAPAFAEAPGAQDRDWWVDALITCVYSLCTVAPGIVMMATGYQYSSRYDNPLLVTFAAWLFIVPLLLRRHYPLLMVVLAGYAGAIQVLVSSLPPLTAIAVPLMAFSVARWVRGRSAHLVIWIGLFAAVAGPARWLLFMFPFVPVTVLMFVLGVGVCFGGVVTPYAIGRRLQERALVAEEQQARVRERRQAVETVTVQRARMAEIDTRNRIAQELHDIVAHSLSVMIVQAEGGQALAARDPHQAAEVLGTIADTGREALGEMRRIVSVLRADPAETAEYGPAPTLADIPELVRHTSDRATLTVTGEMPTVSATLGLTAYRVVQEALTNFLKHAGAQAHATVALRYSATSVQIEVRDDGVGAAAGGDGHGNGLRGMRERVASMGGRLAAHPLPQGGFLVWVLLPIEAG